ncbi:MAG: 8-oxo-dGTP diphosphatase [Proteobacteria bacterium]|nr:8-oxo-dGTP diphosphatase [Pseudomonadota bacterium]MBU1715610.1 8-oxo-dGTP diphosphatase [Pseudomonadota bacterium]
MLYTPIIGTLGFIVSPDRTKTLLVHRNKRTDDNHFNKYNGLGGKMRPDEDIISCLKREIMEEAGITCEKTLLRGTINWTGFGPKGENWLGFIFRIDQFSGTSFENNSEGVLSWQPIAGLKNLPMWEGDRHFLPMVFDDVSTIFHGHMPYKNNRPVSWSFQRI